MNYNDKSGSIILHLCWRICVHKCEAKSVILCVSALYLGLIELMLLKLMLVSIKQGESGHQPVYCKIYLK